MDSDKDLDKTESDKTEIDSEERDLYSAKAEIERLSALELDLLGGTEFEIVDDSEEAVEAIKKAKKAKILYSIIKDVQEGLFLEKLQHAEYVKLLESVEEITNRHKILFNIAKKCQKDRKEAAEIIHKIGAIGLSNYFGLDHPNGEEPEDYPAYKTALHMAVEESSEKAVLDILLEYISVNSWGDKLYTPLDIAIRTGNEPAFNILIKAGAYIGKKDKVDHEKHLEMENPPLRTIIYQITPSPVRKKITMKHLKWCLKKADQLIDMGASVHLNINTNFRPVLLYLDALGIVPETTSNGEQSFYSYVFYPLNRELALRILNVPTVDLAEKVMRTHENEMPSLTLIDYCTNAVSGNYEFLGFGKYSSYDDLELYSSYIEKILEVLKAALITRLAKRFVEMEKIFAETQISETGQGIHAFPRVLLNIIIQYDCYDIDFDRYATTEPGRAFLYSLAEHPLSIEEINQYKKSPNRSKLI